MLTCSIDISVNSRPYDGDNLFHEYIATIFKRRSAITYIYTYINVLTYSETYTVFGNRK